MGENRRKKDYKKFPLI